MNDRIFGLLFAALAFLAVPAFAQDEAPKPDSAKYCRVIDSDTGDRISLQISSRTFLPENGKGPPVHLVGAVHIGDAAYYAELQTFLDAQGLVLFEGVKPGASDTDLADADDAAKAKLTKSRQRLLAILVERHKAANGHYPATLLELTGALSTMKAKIAQAAATDAWGHPQSFITRGDPATEFEILSLGSDNAPGGEAGAADLAFSQQKPLSKKEKQANEGIQTQLAEALGLKFQLAEINYSGANWRNSDLTVDEVQERMGEGNAAAEALFSMMDGSSFASKLVSMMLGFIKASPQMAMAMKIMLVETLANADDAFAQQAKAGGIDLSKMMKVIIHDRNEAVFHDLAAVLKDEPATTSVAIFYGAGHLPDMEKRLIEMGYRFDSAQWFTAIDLDLSTQPGGAAQAKQMRKMVQNMMEQQRKAKD